MKKLLLTTGIWAFSFSFIGVYLSGKVDPYFSALIRICLAAVVFLPFLIRAKVSTFNALRLMGIGAVQLGLMYVFYYQSFELLSVPEVLVFTIFTPIYVTLLNDLHHRKFSFHYLISAVIAVIGAGIIRWGSISTSFFIGFITVQLTNICFAYGQVAYKTLTVKNKSIEGFSPFGYFYLGALLVVLIAWLIFGSDKTPTEPVQWVVLLWLGIVASGLGYFLWNQGAKEVNAGLLAIMNNALVPAGLVVNIVIWNRDVDLVRLAIGAIVITVSLIINHRFTQQTIQ